MTEARAHAMKPIWPDVIETSLVPGVKFVKVGDAVEVRGKLWMSYVPEDDEDESGIVIERCEDGKLLKFTP